MNYPESPGYKTSGTSQESAAAMCDRADDLRERVVNLLCCRDLTADECAKAMEESILAVRPRVSELVRLGRVTSTGQRRKNDSGHSATVWRLVRKAVQQPLSL